MKLFNSKSANSIAFGYFLISSLYIVFSDKFLLFLFKGDTSNPLLNEIQSYKGLGFVLITAIVLFIVLKKRDLKIKSQLENLLKNKKNYKHLFDNMSHGVIYVNPDGIVESINQSCLDILGVTEDQMVEKSIYTPNWKPIHEDFSPLQSDEHPTKQAVKYRKPVRNKIIGVFSVKNNDYIWLRVNSIPEFLEGREEPFRVCITIDDITQLKKSKERLEESNSALEKVLKKVALSNFLLKEASKMAKIGAYEFYVEDNNLFFTDQVYEIFELPLGDLPPIDTIREILTSSSNDELKIAVEKTMKEGSPFDLELELKTKSDKKVWTRVMAQPILDQNNSIIGRRGVIQDITLQKKRTDQIRKVEEMYRLLADHTYDLICLHDLDTSFTYLTPSVKVLLGYEQSELLHTKVIDLIHEEDLTVLENAFENKILKGKKVDALTYRIRHKSGHYIWFESLAGPVFKDSKVTSFVTSSRDITEWMKANQEIEDYQSSLQNLTSEISLVEENHRKQIAANIHDHLSQSLVISKMRISEMQKRPNIEDIQPDLDFINNRISEALNNSRKITYELSPPVLYQLGIVDALYWFAGEIEESYGLQVTLNSNISSLQLSDSKSILIFRCIQEVVTNTVKYAKATTINIDFNKNEEVLLIDISDNGIGFDTSTLHKTNMSSSGFGLFAVRERIRNLKGEFNIDSEINIGTVVNFSIHLDE